MTYTAEEILAILQKKEPISLIRYGDGEAIVLNAFNDLPTFKLVLKRQLGEIPPIDEAEQIRENLIKAYTECDIIGIPMQKRLQELSSYWVKAENILNENVAVKTDKRCSIDVHYDFLDKNYYVELLKDQPVINYISCRNLDTKLAQTFNISQVNSFMVAPEAKFTSGYKGEKHFPTQFNKVQRWMDKCKIEGNICLVGAGWTGKIYCNWFRDRGGIAFDIGSVFDSWAGFATRGPKRGMDVIDETHKL